MTKVMVITALVISYIFYWMTSNVCNYNKVLAKRADVEFTLERLTENLRAIYVLVYQELTTDIRGDPN
jgi:hypothetical protein